MLHPATLLFAWIALAVLLQSLPVSALAWVAAGLLPSTWLLARRRSFLLLRRARWLFVSIIVLFTFATPGQRLPGMIGDLGVTVDGLLLAIEHVLRLMLLLASLAAIHEHLGTSGMMAGLHWLLLPLAHWRTLRERIVVRLMLVLDHVESSPATGWRQWLSRDLPGPASLELAIGTLGYADWLVLAAVIIGLLGWVAT